MKQWILLIIVAVMSLSIFGVTKLSAQEQKTKPLAVSTIFAYYDILRGVGGDLIDAQILIPPRVSPHEYDPTVRDKVMVNKAALIVSNGLGLDDWIKKLVGEAKGVQLVIGRHASMIKTEEIEIDDDDDGDDHDADAHAGHEHDVEGNPHIWLDPMVQIKAAELVRDELVKIDPANAQAYQDNAAKYIQSIKDLDAEFKAATQDLADRRFIGFHSAYDYLARRYGLIQVAAIEENPGFGFSPAKARKIIQVIKEKNIKVIFTETAFDARGTDMIVRETGVKTGILQPLETYDNLKDTYVSLMKQNLESIKKMLGKPEEKK